LRSNGWLAEYTEDLLNLLNVLGRLIALEPRQADLLDRIVAGPLVPLADVARESGTNAGEPSQQFAPSGTLTHPIRCETRTRPVCDDPPTRPVRREQQDLPGLDATAAVYRADPDEVRAELLRVLAQVRGAQSFPWDARRTLYWRTVFPQMTNWLPDTEAAQLAV
jgi:hypothetical protein